MELNGQLHILATLPSGKSPGTYGIGGWVGPGAGRDGFGEDKISCQCQDLNHGLSKIVKVSENCSRPILLHTLSIIFLLLQNIFF
jgi:hypothetical protein